MFNKIEETNRFRQVGFFIIKGKLCQNKRVFKTKKLHLIFTLNFQSPVLSHSNFLVNQSPIIFRKAINY